MNPIEYAKEVRATLDRVAKKTGRTFTGALLSFLRVYILCHANISEFEIIPLYDYSPYVLRKQYLTYRRCGKVNDILSPGATQEDYMCFGKKNQFNRIFAEFIRRDWLYLPESTAEDIRAFLDRNDKFLAKAILSTCGEDIYLYHRGEFDPEEFIREHDGKTFVLEAFIRQHPALSEINPTSVNTVRIVTARIGDDVALIGGCLRCGGAGAYVDNFHHGGIAFNLDMETGVVTGPGKILDGSRSLTHPATGYIVPGFQVPNWDLITENIKKAARIVPRVGYVGWDIAVTEDGMELIEGNIDLPDNTLIQIDKPDAYERVMGFINSHKNVR